MDSNNIETTGQTLDDRKTRLEDKDPVLTLLAEISASLKDLNLTFKDHAERLAKLEEQKPGDESGPRDGAISEQSEGDDGPIQIQSTHQNSDVAGSSKGLILQGAVHDFIEARYGTFPPGKMYGRWRPVLGRKRPQLWGNQDYLSWLKEKRLFFPDDGRRNFPFDITSLAYSSDLNAAHQKIGQIGGFCRDLRKRGGFFFFRESDMRGGNKIWNGSDIFTLRDDYPLPFPSRGSTEENMLERLRSIEQMPGIIDDSGNGPEDLFSEPSTYYKIDGAHWEIKAPFRRLCVFAGLYKTPRIFTYNTLSTSERSELVPLITGGMGLGRHLALKQFWNNYGFRKSCLVNFQFTWYEIVNPSGHEGGRPSGGLYRDDAGRKLQLQSFLVDAIWTRMPDSPNDSKDWTIILMIPASFYNVSKPYTSKGYSGYNKYVDKGKDGAFLMKPLESSFPMLVSITSEVTSRLIREWTAISDYIEPFVANKFTFLKEKQHDLLLFDDDTFSRSRQYFWVITTISEFIPIIDQTIDKWGKIHNWREDLTLIPPEDRLKLEAIKERFENQKKRAKALRDGLFSASAVVESRLSTRLAQNVKLLTYVSIFYLPLAFCAALWAIPNITDASTRTPFITAAASIGFVTYMIVFNLNALVSLGWATYSKFRKHSIQQMKQNYSAKQK